MDSETFRPRKPAAEGVSSEEIPNIGNLPGPIQAALRANSLKHDEPAGPRLAFTGNTKLDDLLAGIKEQVYKYEEITLPSKGRFYDGNTAPSNGVLHVRLMTGEEEQILATPRYIKKGLAINMIFKNCVREQIVPEKLLTIDRTFLLIYLRGISYGPNYEVEVRCTECNTKFQTELDLDSLDPKPCPHDFGPESMTATLPKSGYTFTYRLPTGKDETVISDHRDNRVRNNTDGGMDDTWAFRASILISDIEGMTEKDAIQTLVTRLPIQDVAYIRTVLNEPPFGVDTKVPIVCPSCSEAFQVEIPFDSNFFFPRAKTGKKARA